MHSSAAWVVVPEHGSEVPDNRTEKLLKTGTFPYCPDQKLVNPDFFHSASMGSTGTWYNSLVAVNTWKRKGQKRKT